MCAPPFACDHICGKKWSQLHMHCRIWYSSIRPCNGPQHSTAINPSTKSSEHAELQETKVVNQGVWQHDSSVPGSLMLNLRCTSSHVCGWQRWELSRRVAWVLCLAAWTSTNSSYKVLSPSTSSPCLRKICKMQRHPLIFTSNPTLYI